MRSRIIDIKSNLDKLQGEQTRLKQTQIEARKKERHCLWDLRRHEQALEVVKEVGLQTQQQIQFHISGITSLALDAVFEDPYELVVEFVERRNKVECDLYFVREGNPVDPLTASGGGAVDIASLALRVASWSMKPKRNRNVMVLDEPMRFLSAKYHEKAAEMVKELSTRLGLQFIIVTHNQTFADSADKRFVVSMKKKDKYNVTNIVDFEKEIE